jgi:hypothetical protein
MRLADTHIHKLDLDKATHHMQVTIQNRRALSLVPSASGIEVHNGVIYLVGDDSPWLFRFDDRFELTGRFQIAPIPSENAVVPKKDKGDFEAITAVSWKGEPTLAVFGSGSKSPQRDLLVKISCADPNRIQHYSLTRFYDQLKKTANIGDPQLNIEAAVQHDGELLLFNRGVNLVVACKMEALIAHLDEDSSVPPLTIYPVNLPSVEGTEAGFSGAGLSPGGDIVFTASVEQTRNWIDDGEVLGSFVGLLHIPSLRANIAPRCVAPLCQDSCVCRSVRIGRKESTMKH